MKYFYNERKCLNPEIGSGANWPHLIVQLQKKCEREDKLKVIQPEL